MRVNEFGIHWNGARTKFETNLLIKIARCDFIYSFICVWLRLATNCEQANTREVSIVCESIQTRPWGRMDSAFNSHLFTRYFILLHSANVVATKHDCGAVILGSECDLRGRMINASHHPSLQHFNWLWVVNYQHVLWRSFGDIKWATRTYRAEGVWKCNNIFWDHVLCATSNTVDSSFGIGCHCMPNVSKGKIQRVFN